MLDVILICLGLGFFAASVAYAYACDRLQGRDAKVFDYSLAALVTAGLLAYLTYALIRPEKF